MAKWQRWKGIMKCYPFEEKRLTKWQAPFIVQPKYDGIRCRAVPLKTGPKGNEYLLLSSEENVIYSVPHINEALSNLGLRAELDGELYCHGMSFDEIISIVSRTINLHQNYDAIKFHIFDVVNELPQMRRVILADALKGLHPYIQVAPFWLCESLEDIMRVYNKILDLGYEGIIVRHCMAPYERKRSTMVMKFKPKKEDDYKITGYVEETSIGGVPKNSLGSIQCESGDGNIFSVGTGFTEEQRDQLWQSREILVGKIARVKYQHLTSGRKVPRFPVFVEVMEDE